MAAIVVPPIQQPVALFPGSAELRGAQFLGFHPRVYSLSYFRRPFIEALPLGETFFASQFAPHIRPLNGEFPWSSSQPGMPASTKNDIFGTAKNNLNYQ